MENSVFDTLETPVATPAAPAAADFKELDVTKFLPALVRYLRTVTDVELGDSKVTLTSTVDGISRKTNINYSDTSKIVIERQNKNGAYRKLEPRYKGARNVLSVNVINGTAQVGALIEAALSGQWGENAPIGMEYNHHLASGLGLPELFGEGAGSFCTPEQNKLHWMLVNRIRKHTGMLVKVPSYHPKAYKLLGGGLDENGNPTERITREQVMSLNPVNMGKYWEIK